MPRIVFVEWSSDSGDPPISYFVFATEEQEAELDKLVKDTIEEDLDPYVGEVRPLTFEAFMGQFRESWVDEENEDD